MTRYVIRSSRPTPAPLAIDEQLNDTQRDVVLAGDGPLLVVAGAGSGKTRTLTYRAARLVTSGVDPRHILLCTFTNRAAREMVRRVEELIDVDLRPMWAGTFHHVGNLALRRFSSNLGIDANYSILDREDARDLIAACLAEETRQGQRKRLPRANLLQHILSTMINSQLSLEDALCREAPRFLHLDDEIAKVLKRYAAHKRTLALLDYDDLLLHLRTLLIEHPGARDELTARFHHVLVDEYQDTNRLQGDIVDVCASHHGNLTAVGDDAQSIYSFRGAHLDNMVDFKKRHPTAQVFKLETNYRSIPEILRLANRSIRNNKRQLPKALRAVRPPGMMPVLLPLADVHQQAALIAQRVLELHQENDIALRQMAALYRAHAHSMELQIELARREIPFVVRSGVRFFEQAHIKDVVAYLRVVHNARDPLAWQRILRTWSGVGRRTSEHVLEQLLDPEQAPEASSLLQSERLLQRVPSSARPALERLAALLQKLHDEPGVSPAVEKVLDSYYRDYLTATYANAATRVEDLSQLADYARRYESLEQFLSELSLVAGFAAEGVRPGQPSDDAFVLSTVHQAKGLEWRIVFVLGLAEGRFPQPMAVRTPAELEEERRLFYVAATRAKDQLYLCHPRFDESGTGPRRILRLSRFVDELGHDGDFPYERWEIEQC